MSYYDGDGDYIIYENDNDGNSDRSDEGESGEYSYPEDEDDLGFVHHADEDDDEEEEEEEIGDDEEEEGEEEELDGDGDIRGVRNGRRGDRISFLQDIVSRLAEQRSGDEADSEERAFGRSLPSLLQELGRSEGFFSSGMSSTSSSREGTRYYKLIENVLQAEDDPYIAMESLRELAEQLLMINPLIAERVIPSGKLMDALIHVMSSPLLQGELELQLIACRCLYNCYEMNPEMIEVSVDRDIIEVLKGKLAEISYIDLAEQVLETLEFISRVHGLEILRSGSLVCCLQYLDFFTVHAQKKALSIIANSCARAKESDYEMVSEIFPSLKTIFLNNPNPVIVKPVLITLYSISGSLNKKSLSTLFDIELVKRFLSLLCSDGELEGESALKTLTILSLLVSTNAELSKQILLDCELLNVIQSIFQPFKKKATSGFGETLIYVPRELLLCITTFILLLLPTEDSQVLTADETKVFTFDDKKTAFVNLITQLIPCLVEIYSNTVDTKIRYTVLAALATIFTCIPRNSDVDTSSVISLISSGLINGSHASAQELKSETGAILVALLSLASIMMSTNPEVYLTKLVKEGIPDALAAFKSHYDTEVVKKHSAGASAGASGDDNDEEEEEEEATNLDATPIFGSESDGAEDDDNDEKDTFRMEYDEMNIPEFVKPRKIRINIYDHLTPYYLMKHISMFSTGLVEIFSSNVDEIATELSDINAIVAKMKGLNVTADSEQYWTEFWAELKSTLFNDNYSISGFELISTGLVDAMASIFERDETKQSLSRKTFLKVFEDRLADFVKLLQNALSRTESFAILDAGTGNNESPSSSLVKQMKIRIVLDSSDDAIDEAIEEEEEEGTKTLGNMIPENLRDVVIAVHCVASLKTLDDFLKHKIIQSEFLSTIIPTMSRLSSQINPVSMAKELEKIDFEFSLNGKPLDQSSTIYSAVFKEAMREGRPTSSIWTNVPTFKFRKIAKKTETHKLQSLYPDSAFESADLKPVKSILTVLKCSLHKSVPASAYVNSKISAKLSRQLEEPLIVACGVLPNWVLDITRNYGFLFPFDTRITFLQNTSYGYGRLIQYWREKLLDSNSSSGNSSNSADNPLNQLGRLTRHKLRVSRETLFLSGIKILEKYGSSPNVLEIEYKDEEGTGLGPTLEFYSLMSKEFAKKSLNMWRIDSTEAYDLEEKYVTNTLFPGPLVGADEEENGKVLKLFENLGTFVARSMQDNRILDFRFNEMFFELMHKQCRGEQLDLQDFETCINMIQLVDPQLGKSLRFLYENRKDPSIESLDLYFMLPGYNVELLEGGSKILVSSENVEEYLIRIFDQILAKGIQRQLNAFVTGFSKSFPYSSLLILTPEELSGLFGAVEEDWSAETLFSCIHADHGYSMDSPTITNLIHTLATFSPQERRLFLQFITGSPKLPLGGFKNLKPKFTVVLKHPDDNTSPDECLPSVMTCANYLKLPKYSDKTMLRNRLVQAMTEGSGAFLLS